MRELASRNGRAWTASSEAMATSHHQALWNSINPSAHGSTRYLLLSAAPNSSIDNVAPPSYSNAVSW